MGHRVLRQGFSYLSTVRVLAIVPFLNEEEYLPTFLATCVQQTRPPDHLMLVDDGSTDRSGEIASAFSEAHAFAELLTRPQRLEAEDRLATAAELRAFHWALQQRAEAWDVVVKLDADLAMMPTHFSEVLSTLERDPHLGICGAYLSRPDRGRGHMRELHPRTHVRGPNKFYRRACYDDITPIPEILGWDGIDEVKARALGWATRSIELSAGDSIHLRPTGTKDGLLRANRRWGLCAYAVGAHPLFALATAVSRCRTPPLLLAGCNYWYGYLRASFLRTPRAELLVRRQVRYEERRRLADAVRRHSERRPRFIAR